VAALAGGGSAAKGRVALEVTAQAQMSQTWTAGLAVASASPPASPAGQPSPQTLFATEIAAAQRSREALATLESAGDSQDSHSSSPVPLPLALALESSSSSSIDSPGGASEGDPARVGTAQPATARRGTVEATGWSPPGSPPGSPTGSPMLPGSSWKASPGEGAAEELLRVGDGGEKESSLPAVGRGGGSGEAADDGSAEVAAAADPRGTGGSTGGSDAPRASLRATGPAAKAEAEARRKQRKAEEKAAEAHEIANR
jgi:hypothetical protein